MPAPLYIHIYTRGKSQRRIIIRIHAYTISLIHTLLLCVCMYVCMNMVRWFVDSPRISCGTEPVVLGSPGGSGPDTTVRSAVDRMAQNLSYTYIHTFIPVSYIYIYGINTLFWKFISLDTTAAVRNASILSSTLSRRSISLSSYSTTT